MEIQNKHESCQVFLQIVFTIISDVYYVLFLYPDSIH